jgi:uncharacterized protein YbjT (DUF2867 family)
MPNVLQNRIQREHSMASPIVTVFGGSGFLGRYVTRQLAQQGCRVRVAVRRPNEALFVRPYGSVGQVEPVQANVRDEASVRAAIRGAEAVVNCSAIAFGDRRAVMESVQATGAGLVARVAHEEGVARLVHVSAIGADAASDSDYARTKGEGEVAVLAAFPKAVILRPSVLFGTEDGFLNRLAGLARMLPVLPLVGAETRFQPAFVDDVARAAVAGALGEARPGIYELGGPEVLTTRDLARRVLTIVQRRRLIVPVPFWLARIKAWFLDAGSALTGGLIRNTLLTRDQVRLLRLDNVVSEGAKGFSALGIDPTPMGPVLETYLTRFRPHGQFDAITASAKNLRG